MGFREDVAEGAGRDPRGCIVNGSPAASIRAYPDGPLIVRGDFEVQDHLGNPIPNIRKTVALCRCGKSGLKPFCDGTHKKGPLRRSGEEQI